MGPDSTVLFALGALGLTTVFAILRAALLHSVPSRVLELARGEERRQRLRPHLERAESLATSASVYGLTCQILFVVFVWVLVGEVLGGEGLSTSSMGLSLVIEHRLLAENSPRSSGKTFCSRMSRLGDAVRA
jgi:hypothetical protein